MARSSCGAGAAIYVAAEGLAGLANRINAFKQHYDVAQAPFILIPTVIDLQAPEAETEVLIQAVRQAANDFRSRPAVIVIDTLSKTFGRGKENTDDMASYVANCARIAAETNCLVLLVHHRPKDSDSAEPRGHSSLKGGVDTVLLVEGGATPKLRVTKQKDGEIAAAMRFQLQMVELGVNERGKCVTSCIVDHAHSASLDGLQFGKFARLPEGATLTFRQLREMIDVQGVTPPPEIPNTIIDRAVVARVLESSLWRAAALSASGTNRDIKRDSKKKAFNRARRALLTSGLLVEWGDWVWCT